MLVATLSEMMIYQHGGVAYGHLDSGRQVNEHAGTQTSLILSVPDTIGQADQSFVNRLIERDENGHFNEGRRRHDVIFAEADVLAGAEIRQGVRPLAAVR